MNFCFPEPCVRVDVQAALNDLVDFDLIRFSDDGQELVYVRNDDSVTETLKKTWDNVFRRQIQHQGAS